MLSIDFIRDNKEKVIKGTRDKGILKFNNKTIEDVVDELLSIDEKRKNILTQIQTINREKHELTKEEGLRVGKQLNKKKVSLKKESVNIEKKYKELRYLIPNLPASDVKKGQNEAENEIIRQYKKPQTFDFKPKDHVELGESLDIFDLKRGAKVSGSRFGYLKNEGVQLEFALVQLVFRTLIKEGFMPVIPPVLIKHEITSALGYWQGGEHNEYYWVNEPREKQGLYLVGTAEHSIVPMHKDETFAANQLPKRYIGSSSCFRREVGSYGKDVRGMLRVHQFDKLEMVSFTTPENSDKEHDYLLSIEEKLFQMLDIPYQVIKMCSGDLGFPAARKYDIEAWLPSQNLYREVTSTSTTTDFQARRLNIKYRANGESRFVHILNGTAFAMGRTLIAILENYQQQNGSVLIPTVLQPLIGFDTIHSKRR